MSSFLYEDQRATQQQEKSMAILEKKAPINNSLEMIAKYKILERWCKKPLQQQVNSKNKTIMQAKTFSLQSIFIQISNKNPSIMEVED